MQPESRSLLPCGTAVGDEGPAITREVERLTCDRSTWRPTARAAAALLLGAAGLALYLFMGQIRVEHSASPRKSRLHFLGDVEVNGGNASSSSDECSPPGANCMETKCCQWTGMQCYKKDESFATCKTSCRGGPDMTDSEGKHWLCEAIGERTPGKPFHTDWTTMPTPEWVDELCSKPGEDCQKTKCCSWDGMQCYRKSEDYATCKNECAPGPDLLDTDGKPWTCEEIGPRTPGVGLKFAGTDPKEWVLTDCSGRLENCEKTRCCKDSGVACFKKTEGWATCRPDCAGGVPDPSDNNSMWSCEQLGPMWTTTSTTTTTTKTKGWPSLYCLAVTRSWGEERDIIEGQWRRHAGIFDCDATTVLCSEQITVGQGHEALTGTTFENAAVGVSKDRTAGNSLLFMHVWNAVKGVGWWSQYDWTIKADPDAVIIPSRMRNHLAEHTGKRVFINNCNMHPSDKDYPMMFGAVEAISGDAIAAYMEGSHRCASDLEWQKWGEDLFLKRCFTYLGVEGVLDQFQVGDNLCGFGGRCDDASRAAFHPIKHWEEWRGCWQWATR